MFNLNEMMFFDMLQMKASSTKKYQALVLKLKKLEDEYNFQNAIYLNALTALLNSVSRLTSNSPLKRQVNTDRDKLKIYPTQEVRLSNFYGMTHLEVQNILDNLLYKIETLQMQKQTHNSLYRQLIEDISASETLDVSSYTEEFPLSCRIVQKDGKYSEITSTSNFGVELTSMTNNIAMVVEKNTIFSSKHKSFPYFKKIEETLYIYVYSKGAGRWYVDRVGKGNVDDFKVIKSNSTVRDTDLNRSEYLSSLFLHWLQNIMD